MSGIKLYSVFKLQGDKVVSLFNKKKDANNKNKEESDCDDVEVDLHLTKSNKKIN